MIVHMRREIVRREKEKEKNKANILKMKKDEEEAVKEEIEHNERPPPDFKKVVYTSSGKAINLAQDYVRQK